MSDHDPKSALLRYTAQIVAAHVRNHAVPAASLPGLIRQVHAALGAVGEQAPAVEPAPEAPAAPTRRTVFPDYIICLEDGRKMKTLKRHLRSEYNLSPEQYREKWGLPPDYPMVAPSYAERRSELAREAGLGRKRGAPATATPAPASQAPAPAAAQHANAPARVTEPAPAPRAPEMPEPEEWAAPPPRRPEHTAASVFARFTGPTEAEGEPTQAEPEAPTEPAAESPARKHVRKPFAKQFARSMRR